MSSVNKDTLRIAIEIPKDKTHGDYSSNIAMQLTKILKRKLLILLHI